MGMHFTLNGVYSDETVVQKPFNCDCGKSYRYRAGLYTHRKFECGKEPQFPCPVCSYRATRKSSLKVHMYSEFQMFDESNKFICHCGKKYRHRKSLWNHTNFECGGKEPQFSCPYCSYSARRKGHLKSHVYLKHFNEMVS
ncbi:zinc finger protein 425 [Halyomorpha halys]|uniref:zinc finger protein 425 n=1 Tax=Halyomorpha halys TaxID=286706 RepID=UPI0006D50D0B|nr:zinc finger protein 425-like [Halyomorpha halys]